MEDRALRELVEQLQAEASEARSSQQSNVAEISRLTQDLEQQRARADQATAELELARKSAKDAEAAFEHVVKRLAEQRPAKQSPAEIRSAALANHGIPPDKLELRIRFVSGSLLGLFVGALAAMRYDIGTFGGAVVVLGTAATFGFLARHFGDRFWLRR